MGLAALITAQSFRTKMEGLSNFGAAYWGRSPALQQAPPVVNPIERTLLTRAILVGSSAT